MGGTVAVILRKPDGEIVNMLRWTNIMPAYLLDPRLYSDNPQPWIDEFLSEWKKMKNDYDLHKDDKCFEFNMTNCYFPRIETSPDGYGLFVIDLQKKHLLHMQGYCGEPSYTGSYKLRKERYPDEYESLTGLIKNGIIKKWYVYDTHQYSPIGDFNEFEELISKNYDDLAWRSKFIIEPPNFVIHRYNEDDEGTIKFFQKLLHLKILTRNKDLQSWFEYLLERQDYKLNDHEKKKLKKKLKNY
jgi:hypothetical protein